MNALVFRPSAYAPFMRASEVEANGLTFHFEVGGEQHQPTVLLIMGLGAQMLLWTETFCQHLIESGFRVIRFDNRDIGLSSKIRKKNKRLNTMALMGKFAVGLRNHGAPYTLYDMAEDTSKLIDALQLDQVHVIGASMGGMIAQILAAKHPEQVKSLNLLFTSNNRAFLPPPGYKQLKALIGRPKGHDEDSMVEHATRLVTTIGSPNHVDLDKARDLTRLLYRRSFSPAGVMQQYLAILCTGSLVEVDRRIQKPTLVLHGSHDKLLPPSHGRAVAKAIHGAKFRLIDGMGHDIPDAFAPKLAALYARHMKLHG
ncbi:MAG: alpha/beta hydrolase [Pseudomonadota bacterium]|nr:alpha/beta hydrolase [Pseudomonadota bacterium]